MDSQAEIADYLVPLSRRVYNVLEDIGVCLELRDVKMKMKTIREILFTVCEIDEPYSHYIVGSSFEGTNTVGMHSDLDEMYVDETPIVTDGFDAQHYEKCYLIVQDQITPPGYAKLQLVKKGFPCFETKSSMPEVAWNMYDVDSENRCLYTMILPPTLLYANERHGPAYTTLNERSTFTTDTVYGLRCRIWPDFASEWLTRKRPYGIPDLALIEKFQNLGFFLVCVGHPSSPERHLQWRISFSLQERTLVTKFNSVQLKCYVMLKLIKKEVINNLLKQPSITSYHCKTCMFYLIECTPDSFWTKDNILTCVLACLKLILTWLNENVCPNYFIPSENMFDGRICRYLKAQLRHALQSLISKDFEYLVYIKSDNFDQRLQGSPSAVEKLLNGEYIKSMTKLDEYFLCFAHSQDTRKKVLQAESKINDKDGLKTSLSLKSRLQSVRSVTEHTEEEIKRTISLILPYIELDIMSNLISMSIRLNKSKEVIFSYLSSKEWHRISLESDMFSSKLKQATYLYMYGYCEMSLEILYELERKATEQIITVCNCDIINPAFPEQFISDRKHTSFENLIKQHAIPCSVFYQCEGRLTPIGLRYEMLRSVYYDLSDIDKYWSDSADVDGKFLLYFLLYLNHIRLGMDNYAVADVRQAMRILTKDPNLGHKTTALNLLGWIFREQGSNEKAELFFKKSLTLKTHRNAALWHMLFLINNKLSRL